MSLSDAKKEVRKRKLTRRKTPSLFCVIKCVIYMNMECTRPILSLVLNKVWKLLNFCNELIPNVKTKWSPVPFSTGLGIRVRGLGLGLGFTLICARRTGSSTAVIRIFHKTFPCSGEWIFVPTRQQCGWWFTYLQSGDTCPNSIDELVSYTADDNDMVSSSSCRVIVIVVSETMLVWWSMIASSWHEVTMLLAIRSCVVSMFSVSDEGFLVNTRTVPISNSLTDVADICRKSQSQMLTRKATVLNICSTVK